MTVRPIGYYVHHHGAGHRARAQAIRAASPRPIWLIGTGLGSEGIDLPDDRTALAFDGADAATDRPEALHYAPIDHEGIRDRTARIATWIAEARPVLMVVDVSVEIAMLARLVSVPVIYVRLNGERWDQSHLEAFRGAKALIAPFHQDLEPETCPDWVRRKTVYLPGITPAAPVADPSSRAANIVLVVKGRGGEPGDGMLYAQAAEACPQWQWQVIGPASMPDPCPANLQIVGWVDDAAARIAQADIVVGAAGDGLVNAVLATETPFICIPEPRAFDEQLVTARALATSGAAIGLASWPAPEMWADLLDRARNQDVSVRQALHDADGASKAAEWLETIASDLAKDEYS